jgi:hypothetical protein
MKQAEIWFHMKKVPIYEDMLTRVHWEFQLASFSGVGVCPTSKGNNPLMLLYIPNYCPNLNAVFSIV